MQVLCYAWIHLIWSYLNCPFWQLLHRCADNFGELLTFIDALWIFFVLNILMFSK